jgi:hypothetical protein
MSAEHNRHGKTHRKDAVAVRNLPSSDNQLDIPHHGATEDVIDAVRQIYEDERIFPLEGGGTTTKRDVYKRHLGTEARKGRIEIIDGKKVRKRGLYHNPRYSEIPHRLIDGVLNNWIYVLAKEEISVVSQIGALITGDLERLRTELRRK